MANKLRAAVSGNCLECGRYQRAQKEDELQAAPNMGNTVVVHVANFKYFCTTVELRRFNRQFNVYGTTLSAEVGFYLPHATFPVLTINSSTLSGDTSDQTYSERGTMKRGGGGETVLGFTEHTLENFQRKDLIAVPLQAAKQITLSLRRHCDGLQAGRPGFDSWQEQEIYIVQMGCGAHTAFYPIGTGEALSLAIKRQGREADHSFPSSAEVENYDPSSFHHTYVFMALSLKDIFVIFAIYFNPFSMILQMQYMLQATYILLQKLRVLKNHLYLQYM
jgi:hypothetical protein